MAGSTRLDVQPLSLDETTALLSATFDGSVDPDAASRLWKLTQGNVLYLRNIIEQEVGDGQSSPSSTAIGGGPATRSCRRDWSNWSSPASVIFPPRSAM